MFAVRICALLVIVFYAGGADSSSQPAGPESPTSQPAGTQPVRSLPRYYNLLKNEFMRSPEGDVVLVPQELKRAIDQIRKAAADEKQALDDEILDLTKQIQASDRQRRTEEQSARDSNRKAREANRRTTHYTYQTDNLGRVTHYESHTHASAVWARDGARSDARRAYDRAKSHQGNVDQLRVDLMEMKKQSAALASVASPYNRNLPPKTYWGDLPEEMQSDLKRVGIKLEEFKKMLNQVGYSEASFVELAYNLDQDTRTAEELTDALRGVFEKRLYRPMREETKAQKKN